MHLRNASYLRHVWWHGSKFTPPPIHVRGDERWLAKQRLVKQMKYKTIQRKRRIFDDDF